MKRSFNPLSLSLVKARQARTRLGRAGNSFHPFKLFFVLFLVLSFCFQANIAKPLADTLHSLTSVTLDASSNETGPYCEWDGVSTLTFKYGEYTPDDNKRDISQAIITEYSSSDIGNIPWFHDGGWMEHATTVVFDSSFKSAHPQYLTCWFNMTPATALIGGDNIDTSQVKKMTNCFAGAVHISSYDFLSTWDVSNVSGSSAMANMFAGCTGLTSLEPISNWDVSNVSGSSAMANMFADCTGLTSLEPISNWDVSNVSGSFAMANMFRGCTGLTNVNLSNWDVANVGGMDNMFEGCTNLESLNISNWDFTGAGKFPNFFGTNVPANFSVFDITGCNTSNITSLESAFAGLGHLSTIRGLESWDVSKVTTMKNMFKGCASLQGLSLSLWKPDALTTLESAFSGCTAIKNIDLANWNTQQLTTLSYAFQNCEQLTTLNLTNWNTVNVASQGSGPPGDYNMYNGANAITTITLSKSYFNKTDKGSIKVPQGTFYAYSDGNELAGGASTIDANRFTVNSNVDYDLLLFSTTKLSFYQVNFDAAGGSVSPASQKVPANGYVGIPVATRADYTLLDWYQQGSETPWDFATSQVTSDNITLVAQWGYNATLTFEGNGGTWQQAQESQSVSIKGNRTNVKLPSKQPQRENYEFAGYFTAAIGGTQITIDTPNPLANTTYYAHWAAETQTLTFNGNGGTWTGDKTSVTTEAPIVEGKVVLPESNPTYEGYRFVGYFTEAEGGDQVTEDTTLPTSETIYYAHWQEGPSPQPTPDTGGTDATSTDTTLLPITGDANANTQQLAFIAIRLLGLLGVMASIRIAKHKA